MTLVLIGSRALQFRAPHLLMRKPKDFDFIGTEKSIHSWMAQHDITDYSTNNTTITAFKDCPCEFENADLRPSGQMFIDLVSNDKNTIHSFFGLIPSLDLLFTLKSSHRYLKNSPHFWKTAHHFHGMKASGAQVKPEYREFLLVREKETYAYKHPKLNVTKKDFFSEDHRVKYTYDHDDIHKSIKHLEYPAYVYFKKDNEEVGCDKAKFFAAEQKVRLYSVVEEAAVLAIERSLVPFPNKLTPKQAWLFALSKVCSSITSGWWREWAYDHIFDVVKLYPENYWNIFQEDVKNNRVKLWKC